MLSTKPLSVCHPVLITTGALFVFLLQALGKYLCWSKFSITSHLLPPLPLLMTFTHLLRRASIHLSVSVSVFLFLTFLQMHWASTRTQMVFYLLHFCITFSAMWPLVWLYISYIPVYHYYFEIQQTGKNTFLSFTWKDKHLWGWGETETGISIINTLYTMKYYWSTPFACLSRIVTSWLRNLSTKSKAFVPKYVQTFMLLHAAPWKVPWKLHDRSTKVWKH